MSKGLKGITVKIDGDTTPLNQALSKTNANARSLQGELKGVNSLLKLDPTNTDLLAQKQTILAQAVSETEDKMKLQQETVLLYQKEKVNPASGCLPMFIQIPVFFSLYKVLNIAIEIRHAPFIGWIKDLSAPDPMVISAWSHLPIPGFLDIGVWPIVMGLTMYIQQKMNPAPTNKDQARAFALMPLIFTFMMGHFAAGLVIYWSFSNLLAIIQQRAILIKNKA